MSDLQSAVQRMLDQLDSPMLKMAREVQQKIDAYQSPQITAFMEVNRKMQDLVSPAVRSILKSQEHLKLNINPRMQEFLAQREQIKTAINPHYSEIAKLSDNMAKLSKWVSSQDTPISVYSQVASFSKEFYTATLPFQQIKSYNNYFDRLNRFSSIASPTAAVFTDLNIFQRFDYTLIEEGDGEPESQIILLDEGSRIKRIITDIYNNNQSIYTMQPSDFEDMIAELLRFQQFEVEMTKRTRDGGYDLIAVKNIGEFPVRFLVECKRHARARKIGVGIVRSFRDVINTYGANKGIIVTSSYFSPDAERERLQGKPYMLDFKDHDDVIGWVNRYIN